MERQGKSLTKDKQGFTGLEAAIVLTAFIVVAAVFSYMVLGAGFFSTEKAKEVVHTGVETATSSVELAGDVIGHGANTTGDPALDVVQNVTLYLQLTAGQNPVDMNKLVLSYADKDAYVANLTPKKETSLTGAGQWNYSFVPDKAGSKGNGDNLLDADEKAKIFVYLPTEAGGTGGIEPNNWFQIEVKPGQGGSISVKKTVPGAIDEVMVLH